MQYYIYKSKKNVHKLTTSIWIDLLKKTKENKTVYLNQVDLLYHI